MQNKNIFYALGIITFFVFLYFLFLSPPKDFPVGSIFQVEQGSTLRSVSLDLKNSHIIRSRLAFEAFVILFGRERGVVSTDYYFENKLSVFEVSRRISRGEHHVAPISVTIPEGFDRFQIADMAASKLVNFHKEQFLLKTKGMEGYLFPDTYFFQRIDDENTVLFSMNENFKKKIKLTSKEIIIMASIIEREAKGDADRGFISGILWKRISLGMPLQVDAALETYKTKGLPKNPICNPGLAAIKAATYPQKSLYLYYLHDKNGGIHYAKTFTEHLRNVQKYLK